MRRQLRRIRLVVRRFVRSLSLSVRFVIVATVAVSMAALVLGTLVTAVLERSIVEGVAQTASSSLEALIAPAISEIDGNDALTPAQLARLDAIFAVGSEAETTQLIQFELHRLDGRLLYLADGGLDDSIDPEIVRAAATGHTTADITDVALRGLGPVASAPLTVLRIALPVTRKTHAAQQLVGILYFSAAAISAIEAEARGLVWLLVVVVGVLVILALFAVVRRTSDLIVGQRSRLSTSLAQWRRLARENSNLHRASEQLRLDAVSANESLLVRVGADIHDGPVQNLTLLILRQSAADGNRAEIELAQAALEELRNISSGLVLPELPALTLEETIRLAISRHQRWSGAQINEEIDILPVETDLALKICAYRVIQESLSNSYRHGTHGTQRVEARSVDGVLNLRVANQSAKVTAGIAPAADRLGLIGMRLRVEALGGSLTVELGASSMVHATIPLSPTLAVLPR
jgi:signal transduction histidine kinase